MRIGLVLDDTLDKPDGVQQYVVGLGEWLKRHGHDVHYLVARTKRDDLSNVHSLGSFVSLRFNKNNVRTPLPARTKEIQALLTKKPFDILHVQMPYSPLLAKKVITAAPARTAIVGTFHILPAGTFHGRSNQLLARVLRSSLQRFEKIASVSQPARAFASSCYGLESTVIPNHVQLSRFRSGKPMEALRDGHVNIVFLGRFVRRKGIFELVRALKQLPTKELPPLRFILLGDGPKMPAIRSIIGEDRRFMLPGFVSESAKADYLASADIAVFPSLYGESFGIVLLEAMAARAGVVIAGDNPGYRSVLQAQPESLIIPQDTHAFTRRLQELILQGEQRRKMHIWQQQHVKQFDIDVVGAQIISFYEQALIDHAKRR